MLCNIIRSSDVRPGDHLYRYRWFEIQQGVAVQFPKLSTIFVIKYYKNTLTLVTLKEFKGQSCLKRVTYKQDNNNYANKLKFNRRRPSEEIVQNAFLLLNWIKISPDRVKSLLGNDLSQFARKCCTTVHQEWHNVFHPNPEHTSTKKHFDTKQISRNNDSFNAALMCGIPFRQASKIGTDEFWTDQYDNKNCSSQTTRNDDEDHLLLLPEDTSNEPMVFSSTLNELSSDDEFL
ncbi:unnamed protein product [Rotaria sordida]|uniref:Uncharacterized protein n=1 Tax=Rotaria sordida TaxID=392033 RepID=A0A814GUY6_9BILA|nr:unnamed protein product [Rotaria sordida]CAF3715734.1 unnamed protein product [Rotaria sordida]